MREKTIASGISAPDGATDFKRFYNLTRTLLSASTEEIDKRIDEDKRTGKPRGVTGKRHGAA